MLGSISGPSIHSKPPARFCRVFSGGPGTPLGRFQSPFSTVSICDSNGGCTSTSGGTFWICTLFGRPLFLYLPPPVPIQPTCMTSVPCWGGWSASIPFPSPMGGGYEPFHIIDNHAWVDEGPLAIIEQDPHRQPSVRVPSSRARRFSEGVERG